MSRADRLSTLKLRFSGTQADGRAPIPEATLKSLSYLSDHRLRRLLAIRDWIVDAAPELAESSAPRGLVFTRHDLPVLYIVFDLLGRPALGAPYFLSELKKEGFPLRRWLYDRQYDEGLGIGRGLIGHHLTENGVMTLAKGVLAKADSRRLVVPRGEDEPPALTEFLAAMRQPGEGIARQVRQIILDVRPGLTEVLWQEPYEPGLTYEAPSGRIARLVNRRIGGVRLKFDHATLLKHASERLHVSLAGPGWLSFSNVDDIDPDEVQRLLRHVT